MTSDLRTLLWGNSSIDRAVSASHVSDVLRAAEDPVAEFRDEVIMESWRRCLHEHKLDPTHAPDGIVHAHHRINEYRQRLEDTLPTARIALEAIYPDVAGPGYIALITDANGVTLDYVGDGTFGNILGKDRLHIGAEWSEPIFGTNAIGTCLATGKPLTVHKRDHFSTKYLDITCTAAPIFDPEGHLVAVLDIAALGSPEEKSVQSLALALVVDHARRIENAMLFKRFNKNWLIALSRSREFGYVGPEFVVALDDKGAIAGFNRRTGILLTRELKEAEPARILGRSIEDFLDCTLSNLVNLGSRSNLVRFMNSGTELFLRAIPPVPSPIGNRGHQIESVPHALSKLTGGDSALLSVAQRAGRLSNTSIPILITGETGTGKEYFARAIHDASDRSAKNFVAVNCAALPESLIESELFGYEAGSFTGARARGKEGLLHAADGGTLFLDEIGDMPLLLQTRLLRVLSEKEIVPIGSTRPIKLDIRVIAATHRDLRTLIDNGKFREDLYYRLNGACFALPPLRDRLDFDWVVESLIRDRTGGSPFHLTPDAMDALRSYSWPGNIRELANALDFATAVCEDGVVRAKDLPDFISRRPKRTPISLPSNQNSNSEESALQLHLAHRGGNVSQVARDLGVDRTTVHRRMRKLGIMATNRTKKN